MRCSAHLFKMDTSDRGLLADVACLASKVNPIGMGKNQHPALAVATSHRPCIRAPHIGFM